MAAVLGFVFFAGFSLAHPSSLAAQTAGGQISAPLPPKTGASASGPGESFPLDFSTSASPSISHVASSDIPLDFLSETPTNSTFTQAVSFDIFSATLKMVTSLAIVLGLVMVLSWFLQKRGNLNRSVFGRTLGILPLDNRRFLYLVDIMGRVLVLGVTEHSINILCEITDKASIDALRVQSKAPADNHLERMFSFLRHNRPVTPEEQGGGDEDSAMNFSAHTINAQQQLQSVEKLFIRRKDTAEEPTPAGTPSTFPGTTTPFPGSSSSAPAHKPPVDAGPASEPSPRMKDSSSRPRNLA